MIIGEAKFKSLAIEVKNEIGTPTDLQLYKLNKIRNAGGTACICRSVEEAKAIVNKLKAEHVELFTPSN